MMYCLQNHRPPISKVIQIAIQPDEVARVPIQDD